MKGDKHGLHQVIRITPQRRRKSREDHSKLHRGHNGISHLHRVTILLNDAEGVVLYFESKVHGEQVEEWIKQNTFD